MKVIVRAWFMNCIAACNMNVYWTTEVRPYQRLTRCACSTSNDSPDTESPTSSAATATLVEIFHATTPSPQQPHGCGHRLWFRWELLFLAGTKFPNILWSPLHTLKKLKQVINWSTQVSRMIRANTNALWIRTTLPASERTKLFRMFSLSSNERAFTKGSSDKAVKRVKSPVT